MSKRTRRKRSKKAHVDKDVTPKSNAKVGALTRQYSRPSDKTVDKGIFSRSRMRTHTKI